MRIGMRLTALAESSSEEGRRRCRMRILFIGRFQPFHIGHLEAVRHLTKMGDIIIAVGSAQYGNSFRNPFNYIERAKMIWDALEEGGLGVIDIVPVKDIHNHQRWAEHVKAHVPLYDAVFTNSDTDRHIFLFAGDNVIDEWYHDRERYKGEKVREALATGGDWRSMVPEAVARTLKAIGAEERLRALKERGPLNDEGNG
jgi:nicotinamide-nucleotide adenylyltransferase